MMIIYYYPGVTVTDARVQTFLAVTGGPVVITVSGP